MGDSMFNRNKDKTYFHTFEWSGSEIQFVDEIKIDSCNHVQIGRYGGNSKAGANKNEDGALVWTGADWELSMILDGHDSSESVDLVIRTIQDEGKSISKILDKPVENVFTILESHLLSVFQSAEFIEECEKVKGETACLICVRKEKYLWWFSVGDCLVYLLHEELHKLGQYKVNQRQFYEWIGFVNTFSLPVPCYSSGIRELRPGRNTILMLTDGILECGKEHYQDGLNIYKEFSDVTKLETGIRRILQHVHDNLGSDSATIICWEYINLFSAQYPSDLPNRGESNVRV
ncbi:protein phosphatase 2C domain-containing protein [Lederbergia panacisoli]|uniref:protein phosphatase 2C domain-containing protein n=1 Tax=Lederbergia panacisoli TaxID=1255251 RepID=UPI00214B8A94|nr:protein phosphatase 2C domain-containing protein [Lederbergia panacisoli]MCR2823536.1 protein phosphatase 2C domain-containing protein [Lederbergia panacisoli]